MTVGFQDRQRFACGALVLVTLAYGIAWCLPLAEGGAGLYREWYHTAEFVRQAVREVGWAASGFLWVCVGVLCATVIFTLMFLTLPFMAAMLGRARALVWVLRGLFGSLFLWLLWVMTVYLPNQADLSHQLGVGDGCWMMLGAVWLEGVGLFLLPVPVREPAE